jgi:hypothetical protein
MGGLRLDLQTLPGGGAVEQLGVPGVPVVDLLGEPLPYLRPHPLHRVLDPVAYLREVFADAVLDRPVDRQLLGTGGKPCLVQHRREQRRLVLGGWAVVQVGRRAGRVCGAVRPRLDKLEPLGHRTGRVVPVGDLLGQRHHQPGLLGRIVAVDQHRALLEQRPVPLDGQIDHRVQSRVPSGRCPSNRP